MSPFRFAVFLVLGLALAGIASGQDGARAQYEKYLNDTLAGLELMRGNDGLINDDAYVDQSKGLCTVKVVNEKTSPTNIALDIINQLDLLQNPAHAAKAEAVLDKMMDTMTAPHFERSSNGMFFGWYSTKDSEVVDRNLSSVDNANLALALWTAAETSPKSRFGIKAKSLFEAMNFSPFVNEGLISTAVQETTMGRWKRSKYEYGFLGSEARTIYAIAAALGVLKPWDDGGTPQIRLSKIRFEVYDGPGGPILKTWDGGAFQLYLPQMLMGEDALAPALKESFDNAAGFGISRATALGDPLPDFFSASNRGTGNDRPAYEPVYVGGSGTPELTASANKGPRHGDFDLVVTPHAVMMAASRNPNLFAPWLKKMEDLKSGTIVKKLKTHFWSAPQFVTEDAGLVNHLYCAGVGFTDGYFVKGPKAGEVVSSILALDQGMTALALNHILSGDGQNASSRALLKNKTAREALSKFYAKIQNRLKF